MAWYITLHYADENLAGQHTQLDLTTLATYSGYGNETLECYTVHEAPTVEQEEEERASGALGGVTTIRDTYEIKLVPFNYSNRTTLDLIRFIGKKRYKWLEVKTSSQDAVENVGDTTDYHDLGSAIPVSMSFDVASNDEYGTKTVTLNLRRRYLS